MKVELYDIRPGDRIHFTGDNGGEAMCVYPGEAIYIDEDNGDAAFANGPASIDRTAVLVARAVYMTPERIKALRLAADVLAAQTIFVLQRDYGVDHYTTAEDAHVELGKIIDEARGA